MLYLKEYYSFNSYSKVDISEFRKRPNVVIEPGILEKILSIVKNNNLLSDCTYYDHYICFNTNEVGIDISVDSDDWFKVSILYFSNGSESEYKGEQLYYLCDQYEGLLEFFKDVVKLNISILESKSNVSKSDISDLFIDFEQEIGEKKECYIGVSKIRIVEGRNDWGISGLRHVYGDQFTMFDNLSKQTQNDIIRDGLVKSAMVVRLCKTSFIEKLEEKSLNKHWADIDKSIRIKTKTIEERAKYLGLELCGIMAEWFGLGKASHSDFMGANHGYEMINDVHIFAFV